MIITEGSFHINANPVKLATKVYDSLLHSLSILLLAAKGTKLIAPYDYINSLLDIALRQLLQIL